MNDPASLNRAVLEAVARRIEPLLGEVLFVGGQVAELLITSRGATRVRPTTDVDIVVRASTRLGYGEIVERLRALGLRNDVRKGAPICRWITPEDFALDVMPVSGDVLGFTNRWYEAALVQARPSDLGEGLVILIPPRLSSWERSGKPLPVGENWISSPAMTSRTSSALWPVGPRSCVKWLHRLQLSEPIWPSKLETSWRRTLAVYAIQGALPDAERIPGLIDRTLGRIRELAELQKE